MAGSTQGNPTSVSSQAEDPNQVDAMDVIQILQNQIGILHKELAIMELRNQNLQRMIISGQSD